MFEINLNNTLSSLQFLDYKYLINNIIGPAQLELLIFTIGMFAYAVFIWFLYKNLSKKDLFECDFSKYDYLGESGKLKKTLYVLLYVLKYGIIFPFYVVFWFVVFSAFMFMLAKDVNVRQITLISIAFVSTVRITSYLKQELSLELAKLIPFALLAIFLTEPNFFSFELLIVRLEAIPSLGFDLLQFLIFCILLEWFLRILYFIKLMAVQSVTNEKIK